MRFIYAMLALYCLAISWVAGSVSFVLYSSAKMIARIALVCTDTAYAAWEKSK